MEEKLAKETAEAEEAAAFAEQERIEWEEAEAERSSLVAEANAAVEAEKQRLLALEADRKQLE